MSSSSDIFDKKRDEVDYYKIIGCDEQSSVSFNKYIQDKVY